MHTTLPDLSFLDPPEEPRPLPAPAWDAAVAIELMHGADGVVAAAGVSGTDPEVAAAAARCVEAGRRVDMAGVIEACAAVRRRVAALRGRGP